MAIIRMKGENMRNTNNDDLRQMPLKDISTVIIDTTKSCDERIRSYVEQIGNPYRYIDNGVIVEIEYADTNISLHDRLLSYATNIDKGTGNWW